MYFHSLALQEVSVAQAYQPIISTFQRMHVLSAQFREEEREADESIVYVMIFGGINLFLLI